MAKRFVSIVFFSDRFQVLKLNSSFTSIEKLATYQIPAGVIENYRVADTQKLAQIIKGVWKQMGLGERSVGIVVPEFSTYSKLLQMPKLPVDELDEAIRWKSQEFLPSSAKHVLDWQTIRELDTSFEILVASIQEDILAGYAQAVGDAGLLPLVVGTPSISLVRMAKDHDKGKLVVYMGPEEAILLVAVGKAILGSSVVSRKNLQEILNTAQRIQKHYEQVKVEQLFLGGVGVNAEFSGQLERAVGIKTQQLGQGLAISGVPQFGEYLIAISNQMKNPAQPDSAETINLLPSHWVQHYKEKLFDVQFWSLSLVGGIAIWISFIASLGAFMFLNDELGALEAQNGGAVVSEDKELVEEVGRVNKLAQSINQIQTASVSPQMVVNKLVEITPVNIQITSYSVSANDGSVKIQGVALDRSSLIEFRQALEVSDEFNAPPLPVSSLAQEGNISFDLAFDYLALKETKKAPPKLKI